MRQNDCLMDRSNFTEEVTLCTSAMRNRSIGFVFVSVFIWGVITYFLFLDRPIGKRQDENVLSNQINKLSKEVRQQITANQQLFQQLLQRELKKKQEEKEAALVRNAKKDDTQKSEKEKQSFVAEKAKSFDNNLVETTSRKDTDAEASDVPNPEEILKKEAEDQEAKLRSIATKKTLADGSPIIAVLVFSCNRPTVQRCLDQLIKLRPSVEQFPIIVSQDCEHRQTAEVIKSYGDQVVHIQQPDQSDIEIPVKEKKFKGYFKIARHYGWALNHVFLELGFETTIIVEDDLDIAPDFFEYFLGTYPILVADESLWCVSAWNDHGKSGLVDEKAWDVLYRTDFFPGLGWMLTRKLWLELSPKWPKSYWDDWIRQPEQRQNRACIRPELSRTRTFGKIGVSNGLFFEKHLKFIKLNEQFVPFTKMNLSYLLKDNYDLAFVNEVYQSTIVSYSELKSGNIKSAGPVRIPYYTRQFYKNTARMLGLMDDFRSGVPRTGYRGVVTFFYNGRRVHLAPYADWNGYDITWS